MSRMRLAPLLVLTLASGLTLVACTGQTTPPVDTPAPDTSASSQPSQSGAASSPAPGTTSSGTPTATTSASPSARPTASGPSCDSLVTAQELYDYDPNYSDVSDSVAPANCVWTTGSKASNITLTLAPKSSTTHPGTAVPGYHGTFATAGDTGTVHATIGSYDVTLASNTFATVDDAVRFLDLFGSDLH